MTLNTANYCDSPSQQAYLVDIDPEVLKRAPGFDPDSPPDMSDQRWGAQIHEYYGYRPSWENEAEPTGRLRGTMYFAA